MSDNPRNMQFAGFAKALWDEIGKMHDVFCEESDTGPGSLAQDMDRAQDLDRSIQKLIARRAYDLVEHAVSHVSESQAAQMEARFMSADEVVNDIPDMDELPKEEEEQEFKLSDELRELLNHDEGMIVRMDPCGPRHIELTTEDGKMYKGTVYYQGEVK